VNPTAISRLKALPSYTGFFVSEISSDIHAKNGALKNPPGMPAPVAKDNVYVAITLASCDGQPLGETGATGALSISADTLIFFLELSR